MYGCATISAAMVRYLTIHSCRGCACAAKSLCSCIITEWYVLQHAANASILVCNPLGLQADCGVVVFRIAGLMLWWLGRKEFHLNDVKTVCGHLYTLLLLYAIVTLTAPCNIPLSCWYQHLGEDDFSVTRWHSPHPAQHPAVSHNWQCSASLYMALCRCY